MFGGWVFPCVVVGTGDGEVAHLGASEPGTEEFKVVSLWRS